MQHIIVDRYVVNLMKLGSGSVEYNSAYVYSIECCFNAFTIDAHEQTQYRVFISCIILFTNDLYCLTNIWTVRSFKSVKEDFL